MSTAERRSARSAGFTFLETIIVLAIVSLLAIGLGQTIGSTQQTEQYLRAVRRASERVQKVGYELRGHVSASHRVYGRDATGTEYLAAMDLSEVPTVAGARLPRVDIVGPMAPDGPGEQATGNVILFARESDAAPAVADALTKKIRAIDTYRFVCIYPSPTSRRLMGDDTTADDLVIWRSEAFPSKNQIEAIASSTERTSVVRDLYNRFGYDFAWDPGQPAGKAFFALSATGTMASAAKSNHQVQEDGAISDRGRLVYADVQLAATDATPLRRALLTVEPGNVWRPNGFEVKFVGEAGQRKVWMHLVVESPASQGRVAVAPLTVLVAAQDQ